MLLNIPLHFGATLLVVYGIFCIPLTPAIAISLMVAAIILAVDSIVKVATHGRKDNKTTRNSKIIQD